VFPADSLYYIKQLPWFYWFGIALLAVTLILLLFKPLNKGKIFAEIGLIAILTLYLFGTTSFIYTNARFLDVYGVADLVTHVSSTGHLAGLSSPYLTFNPTAVVFFSSSNLVLGTEVLSFAKFYPIVSTFLLVFMIYALSHKIVPRYCVMAPVAYLSLAWVQEYHMAPQNYALLLTIPLIILLMKLLESNSALTKTILILALWFLLVYSHAATPLLNLFALIALLIVYVLITRVPLHQARLIAGYISPYMKRILSPITIFAVVYIAYIMFENSMVFDNMVDWFQITISNILNGETFALASRNATNPAPSYVQANIIRWIVIGGTLILGLVSSLYLIVKKRAFNWSLIMGSFFIGYMGFSAYLVFGGFATYGPDRGYIFGIIPFSIMTAMLLGSAYNSIREPQVRLPNGRNQIDLPITHNQYGTKLAILVVLFIVASMFLIPVTRYASDPYGFVPESEIAARHFIEDNPGLGEVIGYRYFGAPLMFSTYRYNLLELKQQGGQEYLDGFNSGDLNRMYDSGQSQIYVQK